MNYYFFCNLVLLFSFIPNVNADGNQYSILQHDEAYNEEPCARAAFYVPIKFTRSGIRCFLKHAFNQPEYATEFLPYNFTHAVQFLEYGNTTEQSSVYMQSIVRLFYNKLKGTHFVTSYALHEFLEPLPALLKTYCAPNQTESLLEQLKTSINDILYNSFLQNFLVFKKNPDSFFDNISDTILEEMQEKVPQTHIDQEQLRQSVLRLLEQAFNKVIWSPSDGQETWKSVKIFAQQLEKLHTTDIINQDELDDLFTSLIERFCYYLNIHGAGTSLETLEAIRKDIGSKKLLLLELEEQETYLEPKRDRLERALITTEAKIHAFAQGIVT